MRHPVFPTTDWPLWKQQDHFYNTAVFFGVTWISFISRENPEKQHETTNTIGNHEVSARHLDPFISGWNPSSFTKTTVDHTTCVPARFWWEFFHGKNYAQKMKELVPVFTKGQAENEENTSEATIDFQGTFVSFRGGIYLYLDLFGGKQLTHFWRLPHHHHFFELPGAVFGTKKGHCGPLWSYNWVCPCWIFVRVIEMTWLTEHHWSLGHWVYYSMKMRVSDMHFLFQSLMFIYFHASCQTWA